jgi:uncharacterized coiled-coil protein SlyX
MSGEPEGGVHRLLDMVVEEVSLVDRAANQRRFLVVKRDSMAKTKDEEKPEDTEKADDDAAAGELDGALQAAITALESLSAIVELLSAGGSADDTRLATLATELRQVTEQIGSMGADEPTEVEGTDDADAEAEPAPAAAEKGKNPPGPDDEEDGKPRRTRGKADATSKARPAKKPPSKPTTDDGEDVEPASKSNPLEQALEKLTNSVCKLTETVQQQQERLGRVEKQFGMPNSSQAPETPVSKTKSDDSVGWPLDLNKPLDRESVDKSLSFHDL